MSGEYKQAVLFAGRAREKDPRSGARDEDRTSGCSSGYVHRLHHAGGG